MKRSEIKSLAFNLLVYGLIIVIGTFAGAGGWFLGLR